MNRIYFFNADAVARDVEMRMGPAFHPEGTQPEVDVSKQDSDFNLSGACFGTDIIPKCTKLFQMGVHGLKMLILIS